MLYKMASERMKYGLGSRPHGPCSVLDNVSSGLAEGHERHIVILELERWFLGLMGIGDQSRQEIDKEVLEAAMT